MLKWLIGGFLVCVVLCGGGGAFLATSPAAKGWLEGLQPKPPVTTVRTEVVGRGTLVRTVSAPGAIQPLTQVDISAQVSARILELPFREGEMVKKGDVIVRLDDRDLVAALQSAQASLRSQEAQLEGAQAGLSRARAEWDRVKQLHATGDRSDAALEAAEAEYLRADSSLRMAEHAIDMGQANVKRAERDLDNTVIHAPIDGTIVKLLVEEGELVLGTFNNLGSPIMLIGDLSQMVLYAQVDETNIAPIQPGQRARVYVLAYPDLTFSGRVQRVRLERQTTVDGTGVFETEIMLDMTPNMEEAIEVAGGAQGKSGDGPEIRPVGDVRLAVGMTANTDIEVETFSDVVKVPSQCVLDRRREELPEEIRSSQFVDPEKTFAQVVYTVVDGKATAVPVEVGPSDLTHTAILGGLAGGERVITGPYKVLTELKHGQHVALEEDKPVEAAVPADEPAADAGAAAADEDAQTQGSAGEDAQPDAKEEAGARKAAGDGS